MQNIDIQHLQKMLSDYKMSNPKAAYESNDFAVLNDIDQIHISAKPQRLDMAVVGLCLEGERRVVVNTQEHVFRTNCYIAIPPNQTIQLPEDNEAKCTGIFICFSNKIYLEMMEQMQDLLPLFLFIRENPCNLLPPTDIAWIKHYHHLIFTELQDANNIFRTQTVRSLMVALLYKVCNIYGQKIFEHQERNNRQDEIFTQFLQCLEMNYRNEREVQFYADKLCITPKYLTTVIKEVSGQNVSSWIQSYVIQEAKIQLRSTSKPIQEIALELNFSTQSFFGKYFKQQTGVSPRKWRQSN